MRKIALVGNPNVGKSSLFNQLTGLNQKTANYAGATVEKKMGKWKNIEVYDLPGLQSLWANTLDEQVSSKEILTFSENGEPVLYVANGMQLEHSLLLFSQIADLQIPAAFVINFKDEIEKSQLVIDEETLRNRLGCRIAMINCKNGDGLEEVKDILETKAFSVPNAFCRSQYEVFEGAEMKNTYRDVFEEGHLHDKTSNTYEEDISKRQIVISSITNQVLKRPPDSENLVMRRTTKLDKILLHPFWGTLLFLATLFIIFQSIFAMSEWPMNLIDGFFGSLSETVKATMGNSWLTDLITDAIIPGLAGVLIFIPQIAILFFLLGIMESTGYMARISYLSDRVLQKFGLSGSSVIPLMSGMACSIPAIMSARAIKNERERLAVILVTPFMTCSARLPVYTILIALIFPAATVGGFLSVKGLALFSLYLLGTLSALVAGYFVSRKLETVDSAVWMVELPVYRSPNWRNVLLTVYNKTKSFIVEAGKVIFVISIVLWLLASFSPHNEAYLQDKIKEQTALAVNTDNTNTAASVKLQYSYVGYMGQFIEPVIRPLGYDWKIGIALITSFAAREVFVGTLSTIYSIGSEEEASIITRLRSEQNPRTGMATFSLATCISLLLFYVFALQCMSTLAIVKKETGSWKWPILQFVGMLVLAYVAAFLAYQLF